MKRIESNCVNCGFPCLKTACRHFKNVVYSCDECGDETKLYDYDGRELCIDCIKKYLDVVEGSDDF